MTLNHNYGCFSGVAGIAGNERIGAIYGIEYGNWRDIKTDKLGILPPTHWHPLLDAPNESNTQ